MKKRKLSGLSLAEVLIAIFVVAVGILGAASALFYGIKSEKTLSRRTQAVYLAREIFNLVRTRNIPVNEINDGDLDDDSDDNGSRRPLLDPPFDQEDFGFLDSTFEDTSSRSRDLNFTRRIEVKAFSGGADDYRRNLTGLKVSIFGKTRVEPKASSSGGLTK